MEQFDVAIIGAGIAGAGVAWGLLCAPEFTKRRHGKPLRVLLLERETVPGYHTTGRSAAFYAESYGGPHIQPLTTASKGFFQNPPAGFTDVPLIKKRGAIHIFKTGEREKAEALLGSMAVVPDARFMAREELVAEMPFLDAKLTENDIAGGVYDPECGDLDVAALHQGYLKGAMGAGAQLVYGADCQEVRKTGGRWHIQTSQGVFLARKIVNAAGAWADEVAERAGFGKKGLRPLRRTALIAAVDKPVRKDQPLALTLSEDLYFKPEGEGILLSPADETFCAACDAQPEEIDIARAIARFEALTDYKVMKLLGKWAGLRTFAPDRKPVICAEAADPDFIWSAGQGGFGIQTSPAWTQRALDYLA